MYRDWINFTINTNTRDDQTQVFNMPNNIDMNNQLEIWWDRENENKVGKNVIIKFHLINICLLLCFINKIKSES